MLVKKEKDVNFTVTSSAIVIVIGETKLFKTLNSIEPFTSQNYSLFLGF